jgi:hypothetical protein
MEGGWPKEIDPEEVEEIARYFISFSFNSKRHQVARYFRR